MNMFYNILTRTAIVYDTLATSTVVLFTTWLIIYVSTWLWKRKFEDMKDKVSALPLPPGDMGWPLIGENIQFALKKGQFFVDKFLKYGLIYKTHIFGSPTVRLSGEDYIWPLVSKESSLLSMNMPKSSKVLFGKHSLIAYRGSDHFKLKKKLITALNPLRLNDYLPCIQENIRNHIVSWCHRGKMLGFTACEELMGDIMLEITLGWRKEHDPDYRIRNAFTTINQSLICLPINIPGSGFYKAQQSRQLIVDFIYHRLSQQGDRDHLSILDILLADCKDHTTSDDGGLSLDEVIDNVVTIFIGGTGTTSGAICNVIYMLGKHPDVLRKLREELDANGLLHSDICMPLTYESIQTLEYTQCIIKEVLRLLPPVGGAFRRAEETLEISKFQIPKGWSVVYSIRDTHSHTDIFSDKEMFLPERWKEKSLQTSLRQPESCSYIPFGAGPRSCLGKSLAVMEMSVFLIELARLADWTLHNPDASMVYLPVTKCADDMPVTFNSRM